MDYPKHLSEKIREEVAISYLKHELRKIFPSIKVEEVEGLMTNKELCTPRDFWNGLHGISMGFKLKNILYLVTAENIVWEKKKMKITEIDFGVELTQTKLVREGKISGKELIKYYKDNPREKEEQLRKIMEIRGNDSIRETDPIIALKRIKDGNEVINVHDGNGRLGRYIVENKEEIEVFLGTMGGNYPQNFWMPTGLLIDNLFFIYQSIDKKDEELFNCQIETLKNMVKNSESGKIELKERAINSKKEYREKILAALEI